MTIQIGRNGDSLIVKLMDENKNVFYKDKALLSDKKEIARIMLYIQEKCGIDIKRIIEDYIYSLKCNLDKTTIWN